MNKDSLEIHNGLAGDAYFKFDNIEKFELLKKIPQDRNSNKIALLKGLKNHTIVLYLKNAHSSNKDIWDKKTTDTVLLYVDKSEAFSNALATRLVNKGN